MLPAAQAQNSYSQAQSNYQQAVNAKYPSADMGGTVSEVYVKNGESVSAGTELVRIVGDNNIYMTFLFPYASPSDFYVGRTATIYIGNFDGTTSGTVTAVSSSSITTNTGLQAVSVQVKAPNPGLISDSYTASAIIGSYTSYGQTAINLSSSSVITAEVSGKISGLNWLPGDAISSGERICTITGSTADNQVESARISLSNASTSLENAQDSLDDYTITAPISGTLNEVYVRDGDSVSPGTALAKIVVSTDLSIDFVFTYADPNTFYIGQSATVFINGFAGSVQGTVTSVSNATSVTSNGKESCTVRVKVPNPGVISDAYTASAVIGSYSSYGAAPISMAGSTTVYATGSGTVS